MKLSDKCRLCLIKSSTSSDEIFFPIDSGFEKKFSEITSGCVRFAKPQTHEEVKKFPDKVCMTCVSELEQHYNYRNSLIEKQKRLNILLGIKESAEFEDLADIESHKNEEEQCSESELLNSDDDEKLQEQQAVELNELNVDDLSQNTGPEESESIVKIKQFEPEYEAEYSDTYENYGHLDDEEECFDEQEAVTSDAEEIGDNFVEETLNATVDDELEENYSVDQESENYVCIVKHEDTDEEYDVVYEEDITMEEAPRFNKRKYTKQPKDTPKPFKCWIRNCGVMFSFRSTMKTHMQRSHSILSEKSTCFICGDRYDNYANFLAHVKGHTRKSECDVCKLTFINNEALQKHKTKFHKKNDDERKFNCHICNARFFRKEHVKSHIIYKHSDKNARKFACKECPSMFLTLQDQKNHEKSHSQVKIKCVYCSYDCRDLKSIKRHCIKLHNTAKIYKCACEETFELYRELQFHKKNCAGSVALDAAT